MFDGGGEMGSLMSSVDWSKTALGPVSGWSQALATMVGVVLRSPAAMYLAWGPRLVQLYNDAHRPLVGAVNLMGLPANESWADVWHLLEPKYAAALAGHPAIWGEDQPLPIDRRGFVEEAYFKAAFIPVPDETTPSGIGGVLVISTETTEQVYGERQRETLRKLATRTARSFSAVQACATAAATLGEHASDVPFCLFYLISEDGTEARLVAQNGFGSSAGNANREVIDLTAPVARGWPLASVVGAQAITIWQDLPERFAELPTGCWSRSPLVAIGLPLSSPDRPHPYGVMIAGVNPHRELDDGFRAFFELVAAQVVTAFNAAALARVHAETARNRTWLYSHLMQAPVALSVLTGPELIISLANPRYLEMVGRKDIVGKSLRAVYPELAPDAPIFRIFAEILSTGVPFVAEEYSIVIDQGNGPEEMYFKFTGQPVPDSSGEVTDIMVVAIDITAQVRARRRTESLVESHAFLLKLGDALRPLDDPEDVQEVAADLLGAHLRVNHCHYGEVRGKYVCISHSYADGLPPLTGSFHADDFGKRSMAGYRAGRTQICVNTATDPVFNAEERQSLRGQHVGAYIAAPLVKEGEWVGTFGVHTIAPREWTPSEIELVQDVAERTWAAVQHARAERALRLSEEKYRTLFDSIDEGFVTVKVLFDDENKAVDYVILETNYAHEKMSGMPRSFVGKRVREVMPTVEESVVERVGRVALTGESIRFEEYVSALGRWFEIYLSRVGGEGSRMVTSVSNNITERKRRERHAAFLDSLTLALPLLDSPEQIARATGERLGAHLDVAFLSVVDVVPDHEDDPAQACLTVAAAWQRQGLWAAAGAFRAGDYLSAEFMRAAAAGETVVIRDTDTDPRVDTEAHRAVGVRAVVVVSILNGVDGPGLVSVCTSEPRDWRPDEVALIEEVGHRVCARIDRVRAEEALRATERDIARRKDEFIAMLAHELRNPLTPIRVGLEVIRLAGDTPGAVESVREMMGRQVAHMVRLIDDLLDVSRISAGKIQLRPEPTPLNTMVSSAIEANRPAMAAKQIELSVDLPSTLCVLDVDPTRVIQVISNLLHNATKFTEPGGSIRVAAHVGGSDNNKMELRLSVLDSGIGISAELLPNIFEMFTQGEGGSSQPGLGIGLALARRLVEMHGGRIDARSDGSGTGSEFVIRLPHSGAAV